MANPIRFRKGLEANRVSTTFAVAEPVWTTDTKEFFIGDGSTPGGIKISGSGDLLSALINSEGFISGTTTLDSSAFGKMFLCTGTTSDYTITLPPVSGNQGKFIGFRMSSGLTKFVTIDGNASEVIDGLTSRMMWANEVAILMCDGVSWTKIAGKSIPFSAQLSLISTEQLFSASTYTKILLGTFNGNHQYPNDVSSNRLIVPRTSYYNLGFGLAWNNTNATDGLCKARVYLDGDPSTFDDDSFRMADQGCQHSGSYQTSFSKDTTIELYGYFVGGSFSSSSLIVTAAPRHHITISEMISW